MAWCGTTAGNVPAQPWEKPSDILLPMYFAIFATVALLFFLRWLAVKAWELIRAHLPDRTNNHQGARPH